MLVAFSSAILVLLIVGVISYRSVIISRESNKWVRHTHEVLENLENLRTTMQGVQSSVRGYALTGNASFLASYDASVRLAWKREEAIRRLTADNPVQQMRISSLEYLIRARIQNAGLVVGLRKAKGLQAAADEVQSGNGQGSMDRFQGAIDAMRAEEIGLLVTRQVQADRDLDETELVLVLGTLLGLAIVGGAGLIAWRTSANRQLLEARYRGLLEAAPDAMVVVNEAGEIVLLNVQAEIQFGYSRDELLGQKVTDIIPEGFAERLIADGTRSAADALAQQIGTGIELSGCAKTAPNFPSRSC